MLFRSVRIEIETALNQDKRVIPVLVDEARMPRADELPEAIRPLARRNAVRLTHERFRTDTQALITALQKALEEIESLRRKQDGALEEARRRAEEEQSRQRAEEERRRHEVEAEQERAKAERKRAEERRLRDEAYAKRRADAKERRSQLWRSAASALWPPSRPALLVTCLVGAAVLGAIAVWSLNAPPKPARIALEPVAPAIPSAPEPVPVPPATAAPIASAPDPVVRPPGSASGSTPVTPPPPSGLAPAPVPPTTNANSPLSPDQERVLKPNDTFKECELCPVMVVVPAMGVAGERAGARG